MPLSNAERQRRYRERRKYGNNNEKRLNMFLRFEAHSALQRIAAHYNFTIKEALERFLIEMDKRIVDGLDINKPEFDEYYEKPQRRSDPNHFRLEHDRVVWTCDKCGFVIEAETEGKLVPLREQHRKNDCRS